MSALPPAANGTMSRIGRSGYFAKAVRENSDSAEAHPALTISVRREIGMTTP
jgi:hypothetical protein